MQTPRTPVQLTEIVFPEHTNHYGTLFGGHALQWMAKAAFLAGRQFAQTDVVMARVGDAQFHRPVPQGQVLRLEAWVSRVGRSSMSVCVRGHAQAAGEAGGEALRGVFEMVAVDGAGRPVAVAGGYLPQTSENACAAASPSTLTEPTPTPHPSQENPA